MNPRTTEPSVHALRSESLLKRRAAVVPRGVPRGSELVLDHASGALLVDVDGREYVDLASGIGVMSAGHCQPEVLAAMAEQAARLQHTCFHIATYEPYVALCERLAGILPHGDATKVLLVNSGAEAVENAVKIARQATGRPAVICFSGAFHGRTLMGMSLTSKVAYKQGCGPFAPEIYRLPFPDHFHDGHGRDLDTFVADALFDLREALSTHVDAAQVAAILVEPVLGEGGFMPLPIDYLRGLRQICDEHGILLILDEVQTGFCRTGAWGAHQAMGVTPDLSTWAKALGGGLPLAAVIGHAEVMDGAVPGTIGGTFGGNPVACAAALATLDLMERHDLANRAVQIGERVRSRLRPLLSQTPLAADLRGMGAMVGLELCLDGDPTRPATALCKDVVGACQARGVLVISAGVHGNVIRVLPPLVITDEQLDFAMSVLTEELLRSVS